MEKHDLVNLEGLSAIIVGETTPVHASYFSMYNIWKKKKKARNGPMDEACSPSASVCCSSFLSFSTSVESWVIRVFRKMGLLRSLGEGGGVAPNRVSNSRFSCSTCQTVCKSWHVAHSYCFLNIISLSNDMHIGFSIFNFTSTNTLLPIHTQNRPIHYIQHRQETDIMIYVEQ